MIKTNLLPHERRRGVQTPLLVRFLTIGVGGLLIVGIVLFALYENSQFIARENRIVELDERIEELDEDLKAVIELEKRQETLNRKKKVIDNLIGQRLEWAPKLNLIAKLVPERIWLENLQVVTEKVKMERKEPVAGSTTAGGKQKFRVRKYTELRKRLVVEGVTDDLTNKSLLVGQFIKNIENDEEFFKDFSSIGRVEAQEEHWIPREEASPLVWRFKFSMEIKQRGQSEPDEENSDNA